MFFRFLLVGATGFIIDAGVTTLLAGLGSAAWFARIPALLLAMTWTWLANRHFTYQRKEARTAQEALRYAAVAAAMALLNYLLYLALIRHGAGPIGAVTLATALQTLLSFHAYRHCVFKDPR